MAKKYKKRHSWSEIKIGEFYYIYGSYQSYSYFILDRNVDDIEALGIQGREISYLHRMRERIDKKEIKVYSLRDFETAEGEKWPESKRKRNLVMSVFKNFGKRMGVV